MFQKPFSCLLCVFFSKSTAYKEFRSEITVTVTMPNKELVGKGTAVGPTHTCVLLVGDADNNIVYKAKIRYVRRLVKN